MVNPAASAFSQMLEQLSNSALALDPASRIKLGDMDGRCIQINAQGAIYSLLIKDESIRIYHGDGFAWDVRIEGSIAELTQMLFKLGTPSKIQIDGDEVLLEELRSIFRNLKPDIETPLARILGEQPAQAISAFLQVSFGATRVLANTVRDASISRVSSHTEKNYLQRSEFEAFVDTLYELKLRVDRASALIARAETEPGSPK